MENKVIMHIAHYAAPYKGNFIASLEALENKLCSDGNNRVIYVFPHVCKTTDWIKEFMEIRWGRVFFIAEPQRKMKLFYDAKVLRELENIINETHPDIIHTHFDGYDEYAVMANKNANVIWHYHNPRVLMPSLSKRIYQKILLWNQYYRLGKYANIIVLADSFQKEIQQFGYEKVAKVIPNGIQENRICYRIKENRQDAIRFLNFGGRADHKGLDILLGAIVLLKEKKLKFEVRITAGVDTEKCIRQYFRDTIPKEISIIPQTEDIGRYFNENDVFISASRRETFSYAIAEAMLSGTPIISSDIVGVQWATKQHSVITFESENPKSLADKMEMFILGQADISEQDMLSARQYVLDNYTTEVWSRKIIDFYESIL